MGTSIGYALGTLLIGAIVMWYNHVLFGKPLLYWQCYLIGMGLLLAVSLFKPLKFLAGLLAAAVIFTQFLAWAGVVALPVFHL